MIAAADLTNLLYVVGAVVAATLVSAFLLLRHRRPRSVDAGIENFSRELRALQPERREPGVTVVNRGATGRGIPVAGAGGSARPGRTVTPVTVSQPADPGPDGAAAPSSHGEDEPG